MTLKEITALRKAGFLDEAMAAAEQEFSQDPNVYTASAMFWCLNEYHERPNADNRIELFDRMKSLAADYFNGDEYVSNAMKAAARFHIPYFIELSEALNKIKDGHYDIKYYAKFSILLKNGEIDISLHQDLGWLLYYTLKKVPAKEYTIRRKLLNDYFKLDLPRPSLLHSRVLYEAINTAEYTNHFNFPNFMTYWGWKNFMEEDWLQYKTEIGNLLPSTIERLVKVYSKKIKTENLNAPEEFVNLTEQAQDRFPKNQYMPYYRAILLISLGKVDEAIDSYKRLILKSPAKSYLWSQLADIVSDPTLKIGLLAKALHTGEDEEYLGNTRLRFASALINEGLANYARKELQSYSQLYESKGWKPRPVYYELKMRIEASTTPKENEFDLTQYILKAEDFIYSALPSMTAIKVGETWVDDRYRANKKIYVWILKTKTATLRLRNPKKFGLPKCASDGSLYSLKCLVNNIVWIKPVLSIDEEDWIKNTSGIINIRQNKTGKKFAILNNIYIGEKLLNNIIDGQSVKIRGILQDDGRWSAIALLK
ncbi:MAG: hypothetical protein K2M31_05955 [Muribaculaceae bacterium]|nr:hypothetical protein [Muribaculaceae bacterium]